MYVRVELAMYYTYALMIMYVYRAMYHALLGMNLKGLISEVEVIQLFVLCACS